MNSFMIRNSIVSPLRVENASCTIVTPFAMYQEKYTDVETCDFHVITLGSKSLDNVLLEFVYDGSLTFYDLQRWNKNKINRLFQRLYNVKNIEVEHMIIYPMEYSSIEM